MLGMENFPLPIQEQYNEFKKTFTYDSILNEIETKLAANTTGYLATIDGELCLIKNNSRIPLLRFL